MDLNKQSAKKVRRIVNAQKRLHDELLRVRRWDGAEGCNSTLSPDERLEAARRLYFNLMKEQKEMAGSE